jgi:hypothetical protein
VVSGQTQTVALSSAEGATDDLSGTVGGEATLKLVRIISVVALTGVLTAQLEARNGSTAIGLMLGDPTGFSWKLGLDNGNAVAGVIGFSPNDRFRVHADYLWHSFPFKDRNVAFTYGLGGAVGFGSPNHASAGKALYSSDESPGFGIRIPLGLVFYIPRSPVELVVETAPLMVFAPTSGIGLDFGIGARIAI